MSDEFPIYFSMVFGGISFLLGFAEIYVGFVPDNVTIIAVGIWIGGMAVYHLINYYKDERALQSLESGSGKQ